MKRPQISDFLCGAHNSIIDAMSVMEKNGKGIIFVTDSNDQFIGTVTDGDLRRGVLSKKTLSVNVGELVNHDPLTADLSESFEHVDQKVKALRPFKDIRIVPVLKSGKCIDYHEIEPKFFVPISAPSLEGNELSYVHDCVSSGWISSQGSYVLRFEKIFSEKYRVAHSATVMNATCGLHLAIKALGIGAGDEVIVPSLTFAASVNAIIHAGATPVLVDVRDDWCIDPEKVKAAITPKTKAIMPVHLYGQVCDMDALMSIAKAHHLKVVEDCAEAQGASYDGKFVGSIGDVGCFSFFANKIMTTGEGGMNTTQDSELFHRMKKLRDHGKNPNYTGYYHDEVGFNFRMTNIQAAVGVAQMEKIDDLSADRKRIQSHYEAAFKGVAELIPQSSVQQPKVSPVCWLVSYILSPQIDRELFMSKLKERGIDVRPFFLPMHQMEIYKEFAAPCPKSEYLGSRGVNFPTSSFMKPELIDQVIQNVKEVIHELRQR